VSGGLSSKFDRIKTKNRQCEDLRSLPKFTLDSNTHPIQYATEIVNK